MRALEALVLGHNVIGDPGMIEFSRSIANGSLGALTTLDLSGNQISDPGMMAFSNAIRNGSMGALKILFLCQNQISDAGMISLSEAIAISMANLKILLLMAIRSVMQGWSMFPA